MNFGRNYLYSGAMNQCGVCDKHMVRIQAIGIYLVGNRGAIHYPLYERCYKVAQQGFSPDQQRKLDQKLEKRAAEIGLTHTH
jgi:hypothetical protein